MNNQDHNSSLNLSQWNHHLMVLASVSFNFPHLPPMAIAKLERLQVFHALYLTHILCVETLGKINPIICPHFMPLLDVTVHLYSLERQRNQHGKPGIPSLKPMMLFFLHNINNPYDSVDLKCTHFGLLEHFTVILFDRTGRNHGIS